MTEYTPSVEQGERAYIDGLSGTSRTREESAAEYRRMIEEVEWAAAEKSWDEGEQAGYEDALSEQRGIGPAESHRNPYRRNEGEAL